MDHSQGDGPWARPHNRAGLRSDRIAASPDGASRKVEQQSNPKLVCDLWRIAFEAAGRGDDIQLAIKDTLKILPGLNEPQFQQRALSSRADWLAYDRLPISAHSCSSISCPRRFHPIGRSRRTTPKYEDARRSARYDAVHESRKDFLDKDSLRAPTIMNFLPRFFMTPSGSDCARSPIAYGIISTTRK